CAAHRAETWDAPLEMGIKPSKVNPSACGGQAAAARLSSVKNGIFLRSPVVKDRMAALWRSQPGHQLCFPGFFRGMLDQNPPFKDGNPACCGATRPGRTPDRNAPIAGHMNAMRLTGGEANGSF